MKVKDPEATQQRFERMVREKFAGVPEADVEIFMRLGFCSPR